MNTSPSNSMPRWKTGMILAMAWGGGVVWGGGIAVADVTTDWHVLASADGRQITRAEIIREIETGNPQARGDIDIERLSADELRAIVTDISLRRRLLSGAQENTLLRKRIERGDLRRRIEAYRDRLIADAQLETIVAGRVTNEDIQKRYDKLKAEMKGKEEWHIRHILAEDKKNIEKAEKALDKRPFEEVASTFSTDKPTAERGGDLGFVAVEQLKEPFAKAISKLAVGKVSKPFQTELGWHIAKVEEKRPVEPAPLEAVRGRIRRQLEVEAGQNYLKQLSGSIKIELRK